MTLARKIRNQLIFKILNNSSSENKLNYANPYNYKIKENNSPSQKYQNLQNTSTAELSRK